MPKKQDECAIQIDKLAFGQQVHTARIGAHLQVADLADRLGVSEIFIRHIELGRRLPSLTVFVALCNALHVAPSYFLAKDLDLGVDDPVQMAIDVVSDCSPRQSAMMMDMLAAACKHVKE